QAADRPDVTRTPAPRYDLLEISAYQAIGVQFSRGCPFNCECCDIIEVFGRKPRTKSVPQLLGELDAVYATGFRGAVFLVDDNFIGNKVEARRLLPALGQWMRAHRDPFLLFTEASLNLAIDDGLIDAMVDAGFSWVFLGIETPSAEALRQTQKLQNVAVDAMAGVRKLTARGLEVMAGFIVGFDTDDAEAIERQREWIGRAPIPMAMVGLLTALPGTQLERRLAREGRLLHPSAGDNFMSTNFRTTLDEVTLLDGYARLLTEIYAPDAFFTRAARTLELCPKERSRFRPRLAELLGWLARSLWHQGVRSRYRAAYWRFLARVMMRTPRRFFRGIGLAISGEHMIRYTAEDVLPRLRRERERARREPRPTTAACDLPERSMTPLVSVDHVVGSARGPS
ncbi:MAG: B12-binding domain-containing radical SAM protein, partial [Polyangia bacterium]